jgi:hypothetical protein
MSRLSWCAGPADAKRSFPGRIVLFITLAVALAVPAAGQLAILQIQVVQGEGAVHLPGSRNSRPLTVQVTDETGRPVAGAAVSFHLPEDGPGGVFTNGLRTDVASTDARGQASARGIQFNRTGGRFQIRIFASKEQARAGMASFQYVAEGASAAAQAGPRRHKKWIGVIAGVVAGGVLGGVLAGRSGTAAASSSPAAAAVTVGTPTISVGKP